MSSLSTSIYICIDHTFKVTANIGYLRADGRWITQYNSLFIVLNNIGQVIAWQFTRTTSFDECEDLLLALKDRCTRLGQPVMEVYVDNCCQSRNKLHAVNIWSRHSCLPRYIPCCSEDHEKRHPLCQRILSFSLETPWILENCGFCPHQTKASFLRTLKTLSTDGRHIIKTMQELTSLKTHIWRGCLSGINPSCGTNRNENLHKNINPFFSRCRMGMPLALALLSILFITIT